MLTLMTNRYVHKNAKTVALTMPDPVRSVLRWILPEPGTSRGAFEMTGGLISTIWSLGKTLVKVGGDLVVFSVIAAAGLFAFTSIFRLAKGLPVKVDVDGGFARIDAAVPVPQA